MPTIRKPIAVFESAIRDLVAQLEDAEIPINIYIVGGAALGFGYRARSVLTDVDAVMRYPIRFSRAVEEAIATVAEKHGLASDWINNKASQFVSNEVDDPAPKTFEESPHVVVQVASLDVLTAMKIHSIGDRTSFDLGDLQWLFSTIGINTEEEAVRRFEWYFPEDMMKEESLKMVRHILTGMPGTLDEFLQGAFTKPLIDDERFVGGRRLLLARSRRPASRSVETDSASSSTGSRICNYLGKNGRQCTHLVAGNKDRCRAGHPCRPIRPVNSGNMNRPGFPGDFRTWKSQAALVWSESEYSASTSLGVRSPSSPCRRSSLNHETHAHVATSRLSSPRQ